LIDLASLNIPDWVCWLAQDSSGAWWGYQVEPLQNHQGWYENEVGRIILLLETRPNAEWQTSLLKISSLS